MPLPCRFEIGDYVSCGDNIKGVVVKTTYVDFKARTSTLPRWNWVIDVRYYYFYSERDGKDLVPEGFTQIMTHLDGHLEYDTMMNRDKKLNDLGI